MIYTLAIEGDSLSYAYAGYFGRYFDAPPSGPDPGTNLYGGAPCRGGVWRPYKTSPAKIVGANYAISGSRLDQMSARAPDLIDTLIPTHKRNPIGGRGGAAEARAYILFLLAGTNVDEANPTTHAANVAAYLAARRTAGFDYVGVGTLPSRTDGIIANFDTAYQQPFNAIVREPAWRTANNVDFCVDFAADAEIGGEGAADNTDNFADLVHPTAAGQVIMGNRFTAEFNAFLATLES